MALLSDYLKGKQLDQAKEMSSYAKQNNFHISFKDQSKDPRPRIMVSINPEGKPESIFDRKDSATWIFYIKEEDSKDDIGSYSEPEKLRGGGRQFNNFKRFMTAVKERYDKRHKNACFNILKEINKYGKLFTIINKQSTYKQIQTDTSFTTNNGNEEKPIVTLEDEYGGKSQIAIDDHCYVVYNLDSQSGTFRMTHHLYPEVFEVLKTLPMPE